MPHLYNPLYFLYEKETTVRLVKVHLVMDKTKGRRKQRCLLLRDVLGNNEIVFDCREHLTVSDVQKALKDYTLVASNITLLVNDEPVEITVIGDSVSYKAPHKKHNVTLSCNIAITNSTRVVCTDQVIPATLHVADAKTGNSIVDTERFSKLLSIKNNLTVTRKREQDVVRQMDSNDGSDPQGYISFLDGNETVGSLINIRAYPKAIEHLLSGETRAVSGYTAYLCVETHSTILTDNIEVTLYLNEDDVVVEAVTTVPDNINSQKMLERKLERERHERSVDYLIYEKVTRKSEILSKVKTFFYMDRNKKEVRDFHNVGNEASRLLNEHVIEGKSLFCRYKNEWLRVAGQSRMGDIWLSKSMDTDTYDSGEYRVSWADVTDWIFTDSFDDLI